MSSNLPQRWDLTLQRGTDNVRTFAWRVENGWTWWTPSTSHAVGDIVKVYPDLVVLVAPTAINGVAVPGVTAPGLFLRCTQAGTSAASPPSVPSTPGATINDGGVQWIAQDDATVPVDLTGYTGEMWFRAAPDATTIDLKLDTGSNSGLALGGATGQITATVTQARVETLLAAWKRGYADVRLVPPSGPPVFPTFSIVTIRPASSL